MPSQSQIASSVPEERQNPQPIPVAVQQPGPGPVQNSGNPPQANYLLWVCIVLFIFLCFGAIIYVIPQDFWNYGTYILSRYILQSDYMVVRNQPLTDRIIVERLRLRKPGYVVMKFADGFNSPGDNVPGFSTYLPAGEYKNVEINIRIARINENYEPPIWKAGSKAFVVVYRDNGDENTDPDSDRVATYMNGEPVLSSFTIL